eukprot:EG_transcript_22611
MAGPLLSRNFRYLSTSDPNSNETHCAAGRAALLGAVAAAAVLVTAHAAGPPPSAARQLWAGRPGPVKAGRLPALAATVAREEVDGIPDPIARAQMDADALDRIDGVMDGMYYGVRVPSVEREQIDLSAFRAARTNTAMEVDFWSVAPFLLLAVATIVLGLQRLFSVMAKSATAMGVELNPRKRRTGKPPYPLNVNLESQFTDELKKRGLDQ